MIAQLVLSNAHTQYYYKHQDNCIRIRNKEPRQVAQHSFVYIPLASGPYR